MWRWRKTFTSPQSVCVAGRFRETRDRLFSGWGFRVAIVGECGTQRNDEHRRLEHRRLPQSSGVCCGDGGIEQTKRGDGGKRRFNVMKNVHKKQK